MVAIIVYALDRTIDVPLRHGIGRTETDHCASYRANGPPTPRSSPRRIKLSV